MSEFSFIADRVSCELHGRDYGKRMNVTIEADEHDVFQEIAYEVENADLIDELVSRGDDDSIYQPLVDGLDLHKILIKIGVNDLLDHLVSYKRIGVGDMYEAFSDEEVERYIEEKLGKEINPVGEECFNVTEEAKDAMGSKENIGDSRLSEPHKEGSI